MKKTIKLFVLSLLFGSVFIACNSNDDNPNNNDNKGEVKVKITDSVFPFDFVTQANVGVAKVELKNQNGDYVTVFEGSSEYNMVNLTNGETQTVADTNIETGTYTEARVTLSDASVHLSNGTTFDLASDAQGTYSVTIDPAVVIEDDQDSEVLLDLDLNHSFQFSTTIVMDWITNIANITDCDFNAHFRACDLDQTGEIEGSVKTSNGESVANALITININGESVSTLSDNDGEFSFIGVKEGDYTVHVETQNNGEADIQNVHVSVDDTVTTTVTVN